ncbi:hypothetical protein [Psychromicrobium lacuslunae]|uniref:DUF4190 domain-containing protein n=1 Tax=Psychromicrobium lacuslunae TaxID=1618207 RepID=A0A0D4BZ20_9MICC|nr:hypothetical protein [Psychromicrobium lacuslunae]AJT41395.1 hypothetical protein UM93_07455 [Psychromicrobium lacuslunae]
MSEQPPIYQQPQQPYQLQPMPQQSQSNGFGIAALVVGIVALVISFIPFLGWGAFVLGPIAIILGILGVVLKKGSKKGTSITGIILGAIAVVIAIIVAAITALAITGISNAINSASAEISQKSEGTSEVEYIVTTKGGSATVSYGSSGGTSQKTVTSDWKETAKLTGFDVATLSVIGDVTATGQTVSCEIKIDGKSVSKQSGNTSVSCVASRR